MDHASAGAVALVQGFYAEAAETSFVNVDLIRQRDVWKTLVRYVCHNARSLTGAMVYFGIAARHIDPRLLKHMLPGEVAVLDSEARLRLHGRRRGKGGTAASVFGFRDAVWARKWAGSAGPMLAGYTPLSALLDGESGEWRSQAAEQERRRGALRVILMAAWKDMKTRKMVGTLRSAFQNFTALAGEDRDLLAAVTQTMHGKGFGETRAAVCARRKRKVRVPLELNGASGVTAPGGKSAAAIERYSKVQEGNRNRAGSMQNEKWKVKNAKCGGSQWHRSDLHKQAHADAVRSLRDHEDVPASEMRAELRGLSRKELRAHLDGLHEAAERRRLGALCACEPEEISLSKIKPSDHHEP